MSLGTVLLLCVAACLPGSDRSADAVPALVSAGWLEDRLGDPGLLVLHVARERSHFEDAHLPDARFVSLSDIVIHPEGLFNELPPAEQLDSIFESVGVSDSSHVILYGDWGGLSAGRAFMTLTYLGHGERTSILDGGLELWRAEGRQLSTQDPQTVERGSLTVRPDSDLVVDAEWVHRRTATEKVAVLDARSAAQYRGEAGPAAITRPGHIPGAGNVYWQGNFLSEERPVLLDRAVLEQKFREAGAAPGDLVVTYCNTGVMASHLFFVARHLGYDVRIYDPSYIDWSNRTDYPVATGASP